jgi:hypothetical protein
MKNLLLQLSIITALFFYFSTVWAEADVSYYSKAKLGEISISEEGEEATFGRAGLVPDGKPIEVLKKVDLLQLKKMGQVICDQLKTLDAVYFPTGAWSKIPGSTCTLTEAQGFLVNQGNLKGTAIIEGLISSKDKDFIGGHISALLKPNAEISSSSVLSIVAGSKAVGDMSGSPNLEFVSAQSIVLKFSGYVSQWQIAWKTSPDKQDYSKIPKEYLDLFVKLQKSIWTWNLADLGRNRELNNRTKERDENQKQIEQLLLK